MKKVWVWGNLLDDLSKTLTQGYGCDIDKQKFVCLHNKVRMNKMSHPNITILNSFIPLVMPITWLNFGEMLFETFFGEFKKKSNLFFQTQTLFAISREWLVWLTWNEKMHQLDARWIIQPQLLTSPRTLTLDFFKVKFWYTCISGIVGLIDVKQKGSKSVRYWADYMTLPFDHIHDLDLEVSTSKFEIVLFQEREGLLT